MPNISESNAPIVTKFFADNHGPLGTKPTQFARNRKRFRGTSGFFQENIHDTSGQPNVGKYKFKLDGVAQVSVPPPLGGN